MNKYIKNYWTPITARLKFSRGAKNVTFWDEEEGMSKGGLEVSNILVIHITTIVTNNQI